MLYPEAIELKRLKRELGYAVEDIEDMAKSPSYTEYIKETFLGRNWR